MSETILEALAALLMIGGAVFTFIGSLGLARLADVFSRLHGPTKATTLGVGGIIVGSMLFHAARDTATVHELLVVAFLLLTAPVSAHMMARAALHRQRRGRADPGTADPSTADDGA